MADTYIKLPKTSGTNIDIGSVEEKVSPASNDTVLVECTSTGINKKVQVGNLPNGGEVNTASNVGTGGVGTFKQKTGTDLEFKNVNAGSSKISVTDDTGNNEIDIDVVESNVVHQNLSGAGTNDHSAIDSHISDSTIHFTEASIDHVNISNIGTNSHASIDSHIASSANPHSVTKAQVGLTNVTDDAQLKRAADDFISFSEKTTPAAADKILIEDSAAAGVKKYVQVTNLSTSGPIPTVQARRTTTLALTTSFVDVDFDTTDVENDSNIVDHDNTNRDRIILKESGLYKITFHARINAPTVNSNGRIEARVRVNDTTVINGSEDFCSIFEDTSIPGNTHSDSVSNTFIYNATANDFVTMQIQKVDVGNVPDPVMQTQVVFTVTRLKAPKGDTGPAGSGSTITVKEEGSNITGTPHSSLNFIGSNITATDAGAGQANITVTGGLFGSEYQTAESDGTSTTTSSTFVQKVRLTTTSLPLGTYFLIFMMEMETPSGAIQVRIEQNDTTTLGQGGTDGSLSGIFQHISGHKILTSLSGVHTFDLDFRVASGSPTVSVRRARITLWRIL